MTPRPPELLIDGSCGFCTAAARWCQSGQRVEVVDARSLDTAALGERDTNEAQVARELVLVEADGRTLGGAAAVARLLVLRGGAWALLGKAMGLWPLSVLASLGYRVVARLRHQLPGGGSRGQGRIEGSTSR